MEKTANISNLNVSRDSLKAINIVYGSIGYDLPEDIDNYEAIECCIDAGRLAMYGFPAEQEEIKSLIKEFGYIVVVEAISEVLNLV